MNMELREIISVATPEGVSCSAHTTKPSPPSSVKAPMKKLSLHWLLLAWKRPAMVDSDGRSLAVADGWDDLMMQLSLFLYQ